MYQTEQTNIISAKYNLVPLKQRIISIELSSKQAVLHMSPSNASIGNHIGENPLSFVIYHNSAKIFDP
jgi:hypothetical protein